MPVRDAPGTRSADRAPAVSVLVPTFNRERYIASAVESVLAQSFTDFEVIVVDDGSTGRHAGDPRRGCDDPRLRVLACAHGGVRRALNAGLRVARGRYIARNDSDDLWLPDLLAQHGSAARRHPARSDWCTAGRSYIDAHGAPLPVGGERRCRFPTTRCAACSTPTIPPR